MDRVEIFEKLKNIFKIVVNCNVNLDLVTLDSDIKADLGVNSIGMIYLAVAIEEEFKVDISELSTTSFTKVSDVIDFIEKAQDIGT